MKEFKEQNIKELRKFTDKPYFMSELEEFISKLIDDTYTKTIEDVEKICDDRYKINSEKSSNIKLIDDKDENEAMSVEDLIIREQLQQLKANQ